MSPTLYLGVAPLGLLALAACSGGSSSLSSGDGGGGDGSTAEAGVPPAQAAKDAAMAYCAKAEACAPAYVSFDFGDVATCQTRFAAQLLTDLGATGTSETPAQLEACAAALPQASCTQLLENDLPMPCQPLAGPLPSGAACESDGQCAAAHCRIPSNAVCGTCGDRVAAGASCGQDGDCQPKMKCVSGSCAAYVASGGACSAMQPCEPGLGCVSGSCGAPSPMGTTCASSDECDQLHGIFCNPLTKKCDTVAFAGPNAPCGLPNSKLTVCSGPGSLCKGIAAPSYTGSCVPFAMDGQSCDPDAGPLCDIEAKCVNGTCQVPTSTSCH